jgi:hypothetical protein
VAVSLTYSTSHWWHLIQVLCITHYKGGAETAVVVTIRTLNNRKENLSLCLTLWALCHEDIWESGSRELEESGELHAKTALPPGIHWTEGCLSLRTGLHNVEKITDLTGTRTLTPWQSSQ